MRRRISLARLGTTAGMLSAKPSLIAAAVAASALTIAGCNAGGVAPTLAPNGAASANAGRAASPDATTTYAYTCQNIGTVDCLVFKGTKLYKTIKSGLQSPRGLRPERMATSTLPTRRLKRWSSFPRAVNRSSGRSRRRQRSGRRRRLRRRARRGQSAFNDLLRRRRD